MAKIAVGFFLLLFAFCAAVVSSTTTLQRPPYMEFVFNATEMPTQDSYDYIIVGGGTSGCPLAATLSKNYRVLLLERGGVPYDYPNVMNRDGFISVITEAKEYGTPAQSFTSAEGIRNARGKILGGSSAINAGFYSRAHQDFYATSGINWDLRTVNPSYEWVEKKIVSRPDLKTWQSAVRDGFMEAGVSPNNGFTYDHILGTKIGGTTFDSAGLRHSAADLLSYATPSNIKVVVHATVINISLATVPKPTAIGVYYYDQRGSTHRAILRERGEVILSAGAIGSPHLLLLSGIGSNGYLSQFGIPVVLHSPNVGRFLYDNPRNGISFIPAVPLEHSLIQVVGITDSGAYLEAASTLIPFSPPLQSVFIRPTPSRVYLTVATLMEKIIGPLSSGSLRLYPDVRSDPHVSFNYFSDPVDLARCVNGTRKIGEVLNSRSMNIFKFQERRGHWDFRFVGPALPHDLSNDFLMGEFCKRTVSTIWHYHGGCVVGKVVDGDLKVSGVDALRVVDGSVLNSSPGTNPQATLMMLGRHAGMKILRERKRQE